MYLYIQSLVSQPTVLLQVYHYRPRTFGRRGKSVEATYDTASVCLFICLSLSISVSICLSSCLSLCLCLSQSLSQGCPPVRLSIVFLSVCLCIYCLCYLSNCLFLSLLPAVSVCLVMSLRFFLSQSFSQDTLYYHVIHYVTRHLTARAARVPHVVRIARLHSVVKLRKVLH